ncbi:unnamed protein product [Closterium sp. NIES-53]
MYDAVVARYSSPATAALGRLMLPYLFPDLSSFTTAEDLISHLRTSDTRLCATLPAEFLTENRPSMYFTLYFLITRLPETLRSVRDHFLALDPHSLTIDDLEKHLLAAEKNILAVGAARGTPRSPLFEGCSPSPLTPSYASAAAALDDLGAEEVGAASAPSGKRRSGRGSKGGRGGGGGGGGGGRAGSGGGGGGGGGRGGGGGGGGFGGGGGTGSSGGGSGGGGGGGSGSGSGGQGQQQPQQQQQRPCQTPTSQQLLDWYAGHGASGGPGRCRYLIRTGPRAGRQCTQFHTEQRCFARLSDAWRVKFPDVPEFPNWAELLRSPGIDPAALGACEFAPLGTAPAQALHNFTLDSGASRCFFRDSTTVTPLPAPVTVSLADPSGGPVLARSSTVLPCPAVPSGELSGLHLPSFSTNLVSNAVLQDAGVDTFTPGRQRVAICTCSQTGRHLATFTRAPGSSLYTLTTASRSTPLSPQLHASAQVATQFECRRLSHDTLLWHHRLGHPSLPRLRSMHSCFLVSGLPSTLGMGLVLGGWGAVVLTGHSDASWVDDQATQRSSQGYTFSLGSSSVSWRSTCLSSVLGSSCEAEIYATDMAAQELRWLTYLMTDLGEQPRSPPVLYVDNKAAIALCQEHRLEHRTKHIALRYFLARKLQQRGQLRLVHVATRANTADIFTKALPPCDHQRFCTLLGLVPTLPHLM